MSSCPQRVLDRQEWSCGAGEIGCLDSWGEQLGCCCMLLCVTLGGVLYGGWWVQAERQRAAEALAQAVRVLGLTGWVLR